MSDTGTTDTFYPTGTHVVLKGLQGAPEHNGKTGVVESTAGERQLVKLLSADNDEKVLGIRPKNLELAPRPADTLTIKELKLVLQQVSNYNQGGGPSWSGMDKRDLQNAVSELSSPDRTAQILVEHARKQQKQSSTTTTSATPGGGINKDQIQTAADRMASMDPAQLRQQAAMMKAMPKDELRRANPMFSNMSDGQIDQMISQFELMASNPAMMQQAANQVKNMSPEELQRQQAAVMGTNTSESTSSSNNTASTTTAATTTGTPTTTATPPVNAAQMISQMTPEQLKQQVTMLRSMPPQQLRSMHPQFSNMSDAQFEQMAAQMEMMANNPAMLKMAAETMGNLTPEQMADLQQGRMPSAAAGMDGSGSGNTATMEQAAANLLSNMSGKQMKDMLKMAKENPEMLKTAFPEGTDTSQMEKVIQGLEGMDEKTLDRIIALLQTLQKALSPILKEYQRANQAVGGHLLKLVVLLVIAALMYRWFGGAMTTIPTTPVAMDDTVEVPPELESIPMDEPDEFADL